MKVFTSPTRKHESRAPCEPVSSIIQFFTDGVSWFQRHTWFYADGSHKIEKQIQTQPRSKEYLEKHGYKFTGEFND